MVLKRLTLGIGLFCLAIVLMVVPNAGQSLTLGSPQLYVIGGIILLGSIMYLKPNRDAAGASPPSPEGPADLPAPGEEVEAQLDELSIHPLYPDAKKQWKETRDELGSHLRSLTVETLADRYNLTPERAEQLVESGDWSDDPFAVAFFEGEYTAEGNEFRFGAPIRGSQDGKQAKRVIDELGAIEAGDRLLLENSLAENGSAAALENGESPDSNEETYDGGDEA